MLAADELEAERRLIEASRKDPSRFGDLYERYFDRIYAFALAKTKERTAAEDVTAETFRKALQNLPNFQWRGVPFSAWLFRIAANAALDQGRRVARQVGLEELAEEVGESAESWDSRLIEVEQISQLSALVGRLPKDQQKVIGMRFAQEKSIAEIARAMGRSEGAIKQLQYRAVQSLRQRMGESYA